MHNEQSNTNFPFQWHSIDELQTSKSQCKLAFRKNKFFRNCA
uniref:Uncharacterized protein n=1 Tax=Arundo donax TaxID=35708 RepID=A0A0A9AWA3_ARUDO